MMRVIADDLTGACDIGAELAAAGLAVRVSIAGEGGDEDPHVLRVLNTQSRAIAAHTAYARVLQLLHHRPADVLVKKIDTALRGHLGAELDAALDGLGAVAAFLLPAVPAAGRLTRGGCQWFGGRPLDATEFAGDPEGPGAESSIATVLARESRRRTEVIGTAVLRSGGLAERARRLMRAGAEFFVVDAESDADLTCAVSAILELPRPLCVAGSIALARAVAPHLTCESRQHAAYAARPISHPALVVCGSRHPMARAQIEALVAAGLAVSVAAPSAAAPAVERAAAAARAGAQLGAGGTVVLAPAPHSGTPDASARRATERLLAELTRQIAARAAMPTLVLVGGETAHAVLTALGATELAVHGSFGPLVAVGEILTGTAVGATLVTKGGSGGEPGSLVELLASATAVKSAAMRQRAM
jgi:uncharacterized protein YgbK (DUF1537 family)